MKKLVLISALFILLTFGFMSPTKADTGSGSTFEVTKTGTPTTAGTSSQVSFTISIKNISTSNTAPLQVTDTLPTGFTYSSDAKLTKLDGSQVTFAPTVSGQVLTWAFDGDNLQSIPQNQNIVISYTTTTPSTTGTYQNNGCLTQPENVCAKATIVVQTSPNTGIVENILISSGIATLIVTIGFFIKKKQEKSFEQNIIERF